MNINKQKTALLVFVFILSVLLAAAQKEGRKIASPDIVRVLFFPEFYHRDAEHKGDTTLKFECYDEKDRRVNADTIQDASILAEIVYVKSFFDRRVSSGRGISPPYLTTRAVVYNKVAPNTWAIKDLGAQYTTELKGDLSKIVRADTTVTTDTTSGRKQLIIRKYYNVSEAPPNDRHINAHSH